MRQAELPCAQAGERAHGPQYDLTRWAAGRTLTTHPRPGPELEKAEREAAEWERFRSLTGQIEQVNEAICDACPALARPARPRPLTRGVRGSAVSSPQLAAQAAAEVGRLAEMAAASLAGGAGIESAQLAVRAGHDGPETRGTGAAPSRRCRRRRAAGRLRGRAPAGLPIRAGEAWIPARARDVPRPCTQARGEAERAHVPN